MENEIIKLIGEEKHLVFKTLKDKINSLYEMDETFNDGGKRWDYEYKFRRSSKTLCAFYFRKDCLGFMIIFGKDERSKVEEIKNSLSDEIVKTYDEATTFHDGKWVMFILNNIEVINDLMKLLVIKRKPNRK